MDFNLRVDPEHFEYLRIQKGNLDHLAGNFPRWLDAYNLDIRATFEDILPWLPQYCGEILDVGSGLGGIDALLARHYRARGEPPGITLLDGLDDPPVVQLHRRTFSNARIARNFHWKNGTSLLKFACVAPWIERFTHPFDLVVSFGAWCFHVAPEVYLPQLIASGVTPSTVVILDVRANKSEWMADLERVLELVAIARSKPKWSRCVFRVRPK